MTMAMVFIALVLSFQILKKIHIFNFSQLLMETQQQKLESIVTFPFSSNDST